MAKVEYGSALITGTGNTTFVLNDSTLNVSRIVLFVSSSATESSAGYYDSSVIFTGSSAYADENLTKAITHYRNIGGVKTKVLEGTIGLLDIGEFTVNVTTLSTPTILRFVAFGS